MFKVTSLKVKTMGQELTNVWSANWNLVDFTTQVFGSANWISSEKPKTFINDVLANINKNTTEPWFKWPAKTIITNIAPILRSDCNKVWVTYFPDSSSYIIAWLWKDKKLRTYTTTDNTDWLDIICNMKTKINWYSKFHIVLTSDTIALKNSNWNITNSNHLTLISN